MEMVKSMFKNKEIKILIMIHLLLLIGIVLLCFFSSKYLYASYKKEQINHYSMMVGNLIEKHPELEDDIISSIVLEKNQELGYSVLENYGLTDIHNIEYDKEIASKITTVNLLIVFASIFLITLTDGIFIFLNYRKIKKIDLYMNNILNGDYSLNIADYCEGDISNLKNDTYKMTIKLKEQSEMLLQDKKYLEETLEDISHQVKTPLTSMYMINDILSKDIDQKTKKEFLSKNKAQIERLEWLITSLLKMSKLDSGTVVLKKEKVKVSELIMKAVEPIQVMIELKGIELDYHLLDKTIILDKNWTSEALLNIIKNACEHTKDKIIISSNTNPLYTLITIEDNGTGISKKDLPHIFERFYKGSHNKDSIGIGLNMSKKIIDLQNGEIEVETKEDTGTKFIIKFYKNTNVSI